MQPYNFDHPELDSLLTQWLHISKNSGLVSLVLTGPSPEDPRNKEAVLLVHPPAHFSTAGLFLTPITPVVSYAEETQELPTTPLVAWQPLSEQDTGHARDLALAWGQKGCHGFMRLVFPIAGKRSFVAYLICRSDRLDREAQATLTWQALSLWPKVKRLIAQAASPFSARELQCLKMSFEGYSLREAGERLGIGERTVNFHVSNCIKKVKVRNRLDAVQRAFWLGLM